MMCVMSEERSAERALIAGLARGDEAAVADLLERYWGPACRLAQRVTGDPAAAEDAAQEAFFKVLRAAERIDPARPLRPWLFAIVANTAKTQARGRRRRDDHEAAAGEQLRRRAAGLGEAGSAEEAEAAAAVQAELLRLDPDVRVAVSLRYLEELSYREIAEVLGWPQGTVSTRVRRGVETLRRSCRLEEVAAGSTFGGLLGWELVPTPGRPRVGALVSAAKPAAAASGGVGGIGALQVLAAVVVALVVGAGAWWAAGAGSGPGAAPGPRAPVGPVPSRAAAQPAGDGGGSPAPVGSPARVAASPTPAPAPDDALAAALARLEPPPELLELTAEPEPERPFDPVTLRGRVGPQPLYGGWVSVSRSWDPDGERPRWSFSGPEHPELIGRVLGGWRPVWRDPENQRATEDVLGGWGPGRGAALPVQPDGSFALRLPPGDYHVAVGAIGCDALVTPITIGRGEPAPPLDLELVWEGVAGLPLAVEGPDGSPLAGRVTLEGAGAEIESLPVPQRQGRLDTRLGVEGRTWLLQPVGRLRLSARLALSYRSPTAELDLEAGLNPEVTLRLRDAHPGRLRVRVVDREGEPVADAAVGHRKAATGRPGALVVVGVEARLRTGPDGVVVIDDYVEAGLQAVAARADGWISDVAVVEVGREEAAVELVLDRALGRGHLRLTFTGEEAAAGFARATELGWQESVSVTLRGDGVHEHAFSDGRTLEWTDLPPGRHRLAASVSLWMPDDESVDFTSDGWIDVEVRPGAWVELDVPLGPTSGVLAGRVLGPDGRPVPEAHVSVHMFSVGTGFDVEEDGSFRRDDLYPDAPYRVVISAPGFTPREYELPAGEGHELRFHAGPQWVVRVTDPEGAPLPGVDVSPDGGGGVETDAEGRAVFRGPLQSLEVSGPPDYEPAEWGSAFPRRVERYLPDPEAGGEVHVVLHVAPGLARSTLAGRVLAPDGTPLAGARVVALGADGYESTSTDLEGRYELSKSPAGEVWVQASRDDLGASRVRALDVTPDASRRGVDLRLAHGVRVHGRTAGSAVTVAPPGVPPHLRSYLILWAYPDADGAYALRLPPGPWALRATDDGRPVGERTVEVPSGADALEVPPLGE